MHTTRQHQTIPYPVIRRRTISRTYTKAGIFFPMIIALLLGLKGCGGPQGQEDKREQFVDSLLSEMTLEEKVGQITLYTSGWTITGPALDSNYRQYIIDGRCGNIFNAHTVAYNLELQRLAVEESRLGIPLLFGYDVIHGHRIIFPIPLGEACSWEPELARRSAALSAKEAAASGLNWTFSPVADLSRDPRWGRIAEGSGEDPLLGARFTAARVRGYQGSDLSDKNTLAACLKHFAVYGAPEAGRDYNTVDLSMRTIREVYLPPYKAAVDAGIATVMSSFNEINGQPATSSRYVEEILRQEWGFDGVLVTDYGAIAELIPHGVATDSAHAGELALEAGVDMDMQSGIYMKHLSDLVKEEKVDEQVIDKAVKRVLRLKYDLGLFEDPYRYLDPEWEKTVVHSQELIDHSVEAGRRSMVLLKNDVVNGSPLLPIKEGPARIAVIGPMADNRIDILGSWHAAGDPEMVVTVSEGLRKQFPDTDIRTAEGCDFYTGDKSGFAEALALAAFSDVVILAIGENYVQSGEAASRSELGLPGVQQELTEAIMKTGKPVVAVIFAGRPLTINWISENVPAVLWAWQPGSRGGDALADVLSGEYNPSGKLTVTFPRNVGQIPIYYSPRNSGRPFNPHDKYTSKYLDVPNEPLYPFGYGIGYSEIAYSNLNLDRNEISFGDSLQVSVTIENRGEYVAEEIVQLYTRDLVGSVTRPVKELKNFQKVPIAPGEQKTVTFSLHSDHLKFYDIDMEFVAEPGEFEVMVGPNSSDLLTARFTLAD
ncbi:MAG: glycoside hydrolase family 3 N-terminal domain-containing protein [Bacteroidales bacterium]|nr:glycoside hydrolase family 3 N-terminal domain-containing protein [Bacteroidales bacterium]